MLSSHDGTVKQGSYEELLGANIDLGTQNKLQSTGEANDVSTNRSNTGAGPHKGPAASDTAKLELNRKTGDWSLYKFYFNSVGTLLCVGWLLLAAGYQFSAKIPRTYCRLPTLEVLRANPQSFRDMASYLDRSWHCSPYRSILRGVSRIRLAMRPVFGAVHLVRLVHKLGQEMQRM
jgi:hypothetical protein